MRPVELSQLIKKLKFFIIFINGGILSLTDSHHNHHGQKPTMVGICHGGNVPVSHNNDDDDDDDDYDDGGGSGGDGGGDYDAQLFCRCMKIVAKWQRRGLCQNCRNSEKECGSLIMAANA